jgi:hypothetical protein
MQLFGTFPEVTRGRDLHSHDLSPNIHQLQNIKASENMKKYSLKISEKQTNE